MSTLYGILTPSPDDREAAVLARAAAALRAGLRWLQYRNKSAAPAAARRLATALARLCREHGAVLIINDDPQLAAAVGAGVHLGRGDAPLADARRLLGPGALIGTSCHDDVEQALADLAAGADYVSIGRLYPSRTKPGAPPADLQCVRQLRARTGGRICAIGGIDATRIAEVAAAGADLIAVGATLFDVADPERSTRELLHQLKSIGPKPT